MTAEHNSSYSVSSRTVSIREASMVSGMSESSARIALAGLKEDGIIIRVGPRKMGRWEIVSDPNP